MSIKQYLKTLFKTKEPWCAVMGSNELIDLRIYAAVAEEHPIIKAFYVRMLACDALLIHDNFIIKFLKRVYKWPNQN